MTISDTLAQLKAELGPSRLIAVSKTKPNHMIMEAYDAGHRDFGENKVQDMVTKYEALPKDIQWHMIGHLQRNKVKYIAPFVHLVHGVDSEKLLNTINKEGAKNDRIIPCLLQMHIADEETKFGFNKEELIEFLDSGRLSGLENISIKGLMGMATNTENVDQVRDEFKGLHTLLNEIKERYSLTNLNLDELSMGMSGDYKIALGEGSTMVRIGSTIFGARNYPKP